MAAASATCGFLMMFLLNDCRPLGEDPTKVPLQVSSTLYIKTPKVPTVAADTLAPRVKDK